MKIKHIFTCLAIFFVSAALFARNAVFSNSDYSIALAYTDTTFPGDAVFVHMTLTATNKKIASENSSATLTLFNQDSKQVDKASFYVLSSSKAKSSVDMLCGVAVTLWQKSGSYTAKVVYTPFGLEPMEFSLPVSVLDKTFVSETIELDATNTGIRTDASPKRAEQTQKLSKVLMDFDKTAVFQVRKFSLPTPETRRTAFFGDRRVFKYSNGKTDTSTHIGIDFGIPTGSTITACASGKVVMAEERIVTGWTVVIEHLPGLFSLYYHMNALNVQAGQNVKAGETIGQSGSTGVATGPHLHWQMSLNGQAVNPDFFTNDFAFIEE